MSDTMSRKHVQQLIFGGPGKVNHEAIEIDLEPLEEERRDTNEGRKGREGRPSAYVEVLEATVTTVINHDSRLLSDREMDVLEHFSHFNYNTRYCLSRLVFRKAGQWHPISAFERYKEEIGEEGLLQSIGVLCRRLDQVSQESSVKAEPPSDPVKLEPMDIDIPVKTEQSLDVIDLTNDSDDEDSKHLEMLATAGHAIHNAEAGPSRIPKQDDDVIQNTPDSDPDEMDLGFFCEDESTMTLPEILGRLTKDQLMMLVKSTKCKLPPQAKKETIIQRLLSNADTQSVLNFSTTPSKKGKSRHSDGFKQTQLSFAPRRSKGAPAKVSQKDRLREMALKQLGKCIRVNFDFLRLLWRMHIICFRETSHPTSLFLPALLYRFKKWTFTDYAHNRSDLIWETRQDFLEYERALELEKAVDELLDPSSDSDVPPRTPAPNRDKFNTPAAPDSIRMFATPSRTPASTSKLRSLETPGAKQEPVDADCINLSDEKPDQEKIEAQAKKAAKMERLKDAKKLLDDSIFPRWKCEVSIQNLQDNRAKSPGLERFETGYVYTRIIQKILGACSQLKMYHHEFESFECLLAQRHWRRGKRAWWYERSAIIMGHIHQAAPKHEKVDKLQDTLNMIKDALLDDDTGIVWRPKLVRRLRGLEKKLNIPPSERVQCEGELREAESITILADKIPPPLVDTNGRVINKEHAPADLHNYISVTKQGSNKSPDEPARKRAGKSTWYGRGKHIVNVETIALEHYEDNGFKGFHSETRILTMIFALLFWDIIFADIPGAFETPYQTAPLDMFEDTFFYSRRNLIEARLAELEQGKGPEILEKHDDKYRPKKVWCIGVRWDVCGKVDLLEIVECIGGQPLSMICRLFCEDYSSRGSGVPDLIVWNAEKRICKFVEVKGPGDSLQENQRLWVDSLLGADAKVEMCFVKDNKEPPEPGNSKKRKTRTPNPNARRRKSAPAADPESEEEDYDRLDIQLEDLDQTNDPGRHAHPQKRPRTENFL